MFERFGELPDDVDQLKALALEALAGVDRSETDAKVFHSQTLSLATKVEDLTQTNAAAKAEIDRLTSIIKTLHRNRFGKRSEKLSADEAEQQSFLFEEIETGLAAIATRLPAKADSTPHIMALQARSERARSIRTPSETASSAGVGLRVGPRT